MTTVGLLYPGHSAEDDYPRIAVLLGSDIRLPVFHTDIGEDAHREDALIEMGAADRLAAGVEELRLAGAESLVWACTSGSFVRGRDGARQQIRELAQAAGLPASSTSFAFVHAAQALGVGRVAVAATYPDDVTGLFEKFLESAGIGVVAARASGIVTAAEVGTWEREQVLELARAGDDPRAEAVLMPDTALHTAAHLQELEETLGKPVLTANQVTVWEGLRLAERRAWADGLGTLFARPDHRPEEE
ncbi:aspartate/glutamate racemase family protein [Streptomyces sp. HNM0645]|uniref:maleate cis-trans isomerase family protein n=1 Tax=Streptomyces sp. HNM0645 TaxID=2782343 RepID=UPI0024B83AD3|nr:aspartate/glutamate racemase family protein [Streptomyces sp. HNM0645]MDI9889028.1 aspartate/glutamate racemase family protein [Streptomyces sp. HNM0645]